MLSKLAKTIQNIISTELKGKADLNVIDVGCGNKPYYPFFASIAKRYLGVDIIRYEKVDVIAAAESLPFRDATFDLVVSITVLEHVNDPQRVISEIHRVLKKNGNIILSTPGVYPYHGPPDFWRFTDDGIKRILGNFRRINVRPIGGSMSCLLRIINLYIQLLRLKPLKRIIIIANNVAGMILDWLTLPYPFIHNKFFICHYIAFAEK